ncbi:MAG: hypothetical protein HQL82_08410 [Magnetococcales bacterium]|nr:hypothetical protein [Magnetococcales bacterium]
MRVLVTIKAERYELPHHAYAILAEVDWSRRRIVRALKIPTASFRQPHAFMAPLSGGGCCVGARVFMALWNFVVEVDYSSFQIVNAVSSPWMADLHGMTTDGSSRLWVASTAVETVLTLDLHTLETIGRWGPDQAILAWRGDHDTPESPWRRLWQGWSRYRQRGVWPRHRWRPGDYRWMHKSRSPYYRHHLNEVTWHAGQLYVATKGWNDGESSAVLRLDPSSGDAGFFVRPGGFRGVHDGLFQEGRLLVTESGSNGVAWRAADGSLHRQHLDPAPSFVRGLCALPDDEGFLVGFTRLRGRLDPALVVGFDPTWQRELGRVDVSGFYPPEMGAAVHAIFPAPV